MTSNEGSEADDAAATTAAFDFVTLVKSSNRRIKVPCEGRVEYEWVYIVVKLRVRRQITMRRKNLFTSRLFYITLTT